MLSVRCFVRDRRPLQLPPGATSSSAWPACAHNTWSTSLHLVRVLSVPGGVPVCRGVSAVHAWRQVPRAAAACVSGAGPALSSLSRLCPPGTTLHERQHDTRVAQATQSITGAPSHTQVTPGSRSHPGPPTVHRLVAGHHCRPRPSQSQVAPGHAQARHSHTIGVTSSHTRACVWPSLGSWHLA